MDYIPMDRLPEKVFNSKKVSFFRHQGLYLCRAEFEDKHYRFYLTDRLTRLTKRQARQLLQTKFPNAEIELRIISRSTPKCR